MILALAGLTGAEGHEKRVRLTKYHGAGNDFFFVRVDFDALQKASALSKVRFWVQGLCRRQQGFGADGVVFVSETNQQNLTILIINADGTIAATCGNALRCLSQFLFDNCNVIAAQEVHRPLLGLDWQKTLDPSETFAAQSGSFAVCFPFVPDDLVTGAGKCKVGLGAQQSLVALAPENILLKFKSLGLDLNPLFFWAHFVSMLNPHIVIQHPDFLGLSLSVIDQIGYEVQSWASSEWGLPKSNIGFLSKKNLNYNLVVYERGAGVTLCCGSGAAAAFGSIEFEAIASNVTAPNCISFEMPGGQVSISGFKDDRILEGPSQLIGWIDLEVGL